MTDNSFCRFEMAQGYQEHRQGCRSLCPPVRSQRTYQVHRGSHFQGQVVSCEAIQTSFSLQALRMGVSGVILVHSQCIYHQSILLYFHLENGLV